MNRDNAILENLVQTLSQIKEAGKPNVPAVFDRIAGATTWPDMTLDQWNNLSLEQWQWLSLAQGGSCVVKFYADKDRTDLLFSNSNVTVSKGRTQYVPPDAQLNGAPGISDTMSQRLYYVTAQFGDGTECKMTYLNYLNLLFSSVMVSMVKNPTFTTNDNLCVVYPAGQKTDDTKANDDRQWVILNYDLYVQLNEFSYENLSEKQRITRLMTAGNLIRNALYADRYRDGNCTLYSKDIDGTYVSRVQSIASTGPIRGKLQVQCAYLTDSEGY